MFRKQKQTKLDVVIADALLTLDIHKPHSDEYTKTVDNVEKLYRLRNDSERSRKISPDTIATVGANLAGILLIIKHERVNVVASKALGLIMKTRT